MVNLLIFTTFLDQYTYCLHFYDKGVPRSALGGRHFIELAGFRTRAGDIIRGIEAEA